MPGHSIVRTRILFGRKRGGGGFGFGAIGAIFATFLSLSFMACQPLTNGVQIIKVFCINLIDFSFN
jgi:hypothetical protein